jgi:hypothetical protein
MLLVRVVKSGILVLLVVLGFGSAAEAELVKVRFPEGSLRGLLVLRGADGQTLAHGELLQRALGGGRIESRLNFAFTDGSRWDERVTFSQNDVFRLEAYRFVQHGPSFPTSEIEFSRRDRRFKARTQERPGDEVKEASGELDLPVDAYNGMALVLLKNLPAGEGGSGQMVVFTPKPRVIQMELVREGEDEVRIGDLRHKATRNLVKLDVRGLAGVLAGLLGKDPPDNRYWLVTGEMPAFVRFTGAMYLNGPTWTLETAPVLWKP